MLWDRKSLGVKQKRDRQPNSHPPGRHSCLRKGTRNSSSRRQALNYETQRLASWGAELTSAAVCAPMYAQKAHVCVVGRHVRVLASRARRRIDSQANRSNYKCYLSTTIKFLQGNQNGVSGHEGESSPRVPFTGAGHGSLPSSASPSAALSSAPPAPRFPPPGLLASARPQRPSPPRPGPDRPSRLSARPRPCGGGRGSALSPPHSRTAHAAFSVDLALRALGALPRGVWQGSRAQHLSAQRGAQGLLPCSSQGAAEAPGVGATPAPGKEWPALATALLPPSLAGERPPGGRTGGRRLSPGHR